MRILVVATSLPSPEHPELGTFNLRHAQCLSLWADVTIAHVVYTKASHARKTTIDTSHTGWVTITVPGTKVGRQFKASDAVADLATGFDVVHSMAFETLMACRTVQTAGLAWVHTEHAQNFYYPVGGRALRAWQSAAIRLVRRPELVTAVSSYLAEGVSRSGRTKPIEVVPNVIDVGNSRHVAGRSGAGIRVISVGRLVPSKQPLTAVRALAHVRRLGLDASLTWIGDGELRGALHAEASRLGLADEVTVVPFMEADRYIDLLADFDVFLLPTLHETFCVAAAEAIAVGIPVVVGDEGGQRDFVTSENGVLVPAAASASEYGDAIMSVITRVPPIPDQEGVERLRSAHSQSVVGAAFSDAYRSVGLL